MGTGSIKVNELKIDLMSEILPVMQKAGNATADDLKATSPQDLGDYAKGWTATQDVEVMIVHNKGKNKTLGHLLELGHENARGGYVPPQEHIRPAYDRQKQKYLDECSRIKIKTL